MLNPLLHPSPPTARQRPLLERMHNSHMDPRMDKQLLQQLQRRQLQHQVCRQILFTIIQVYLPVSESVWSMTMVYH